MKKSHRRLYQYRLYRRLFQQAVRGVAHDVRVDHINPMSRRLVDDPRSETWRIIHDLSPGEHYRLHRRLLLDGLRFDDGQPAGLLDGRGRVFDKTIPRWRRLERRLRALVGDKAGARFSGGSDVHA